MYYTLSVYTVYRFTKSVNLNDESFNDFINQAQLTKHTVRGEFNQLITGVIILKTVKK